MERDCNMDFINMGMGSSRVIGVICREVMGAKQVLAGFGIGGKAGERVYTSWVVTERVSPSRSTVREQLLRMSKALAQKTQGLITWSALILIRIGSSRNRSANHGVLDLEEQSNKSLVRENASLISLFYEFVLLRFSSLTGMTAARFSAPFFVSGFHCQFLDQQDPPHESCLCILFEKRYLMAE
ncbi:hypothetical protein Tco_1404424 [Tanacetum coccineum]